MPRDSVILNYRKGFPPLKEAFENIGYRVVENDWAPAPALLTHTETCVVNLYEAIRNPWSALVLKRRRKQAGVPLIGLDRDAPWHMGIRWRRLAACSVLGGSGARCARDAERARTRDSTANRPGAGTPVR